ncbi:hypothetical protein BLNAU_975 [Blattamonas nauphoetae]|uniref:Uncharacterized protein n=1 Tax=Blattamonas nauphoetae TaxID=2049346 RepID=A0ABQ9YJI6_9EUKA|nr:hypothetical protein BLNAU_975 [Blattamonas nauphoetae]
MVESPHVCELVLSGVVTTLIETFAKTENESLDERLTQAIFCVLVFVPSPSVNNSDLDTFLKSLMFSRLSSLFVRQLQNADIIFSDFFISCTVLHAGYISMLSNSNSLSGQLNPRGMTSISFTTRMQLLHSTWHCSSTESKRFSFTSPSHSNEWALVAPRSNRRDAEASPTELVLTAPTTDHSGTTSLEPSTLDDNQHSPQVADSETLPNIKPNGRTGRVTQPDDPFQSRKAVRAVELVVVVRVPPNAVHHPSILPCRPRTTAGKRLLECNLWKEEVETNLDGFGSSIEHHPLFE